MQIHFNFFIQQQGASNVLRSYREIYIWRYSRTSSGNSIPNARAEIFELQSFHGEADLTNESFVRGKERWYLELSSGTRFILRRLTRKLQTRRTMAIRTVGLHWYARGEKVDAAWVVLSYSWQLEERRRYRTTDFSWREAWAILKSSHTGKITHVDAWGIIRVKGNFISTCRMKKIASLWRLSSHPTLCFYLEFF